MFDKQLVDAVCKIILKHVAATRIYCFGSRVTGDAKPESDYDFGFDADDTPEADVLTAIRNEIDQLPTLIKVDVTCLNKADRRFVNRVRASGKVVFSATKALRVEDGLMYFRRALERFQVVINERERWIAEGNGDIVLDIAAKRFEFTYEMAWKALKRWLDFQGIDARSPRAVFKEAFALGVLPDEKTWLDMIEMRNLSSHVYDEHEVSGLLDQLERFNDAFADLLNRIDLPTHEQETGSNGEMPPNL
ncbi:HI0074 family nucleotidyltransferase substrate-binding subunit [Methylomonas rosea]|uniref:HI0074 family nucleotidyltransferase substrate-binding subunit n=1 Tax=Methylomonas rosea TaxID=2952227 RepID=A0ABT1TUH0_9GAMM|nr:HI0074 family nucleotidyltransferase substrate-binding subunit [Methylomonas sp. WSC-7]MCQ8118170.1 HI0074 family nucleotidyltransferase substrate-binding subunit [Methylomonas sp. WSC-7]